MADQGHIETEKVLVDIEREIYKEYSQAEKELADKIEDYFARFEKKKAIKLKALSEGKISQEEYDKWLIGQLAMGDRWKEMKETIAHDLGHASEMAMAISAGHMPEVYAINHDYGTFQVEKTSLVDTSYTLYDRNTAKRLFEDEHQFYHDHGWKVGKHINEGKLIPWEKKQAQSVMTQALLQGESIGKIATRLQNAFGNSILEEDIKNRDKMTAEQIAKELARRNRNASIRNARTMTTGVQNAGRVDSYKRADGMGIKLKQEWLATLDGRTRHEHRVLDGQRVAVGDKFVVDGYELEYPADPRGEAFLVYNCRCTLVPVLAGFEVDPSDTTLRHNAYLEEESYDEWKKNHASHSDPIDKQDRIAEKMRRIYGAEYKKYANLPDNPPPTKGKAKSTESKPTEKQIEDYKYLKNFVENGSVKFNAVSDLKNPLTKDEIIEKISGADKTKGSCASLALTYCSNLAGMDVTDFRGGKSQSTFSLSSNIHRMLSIANANVTEYNVKKEAKETAEILKGLAKDKEFLLSVGKHCAIVKNTDAGVQYLELQSSSINGWRSFDERYGGVSIGLRKRFGCRKTEDSYRRSDGTKKIFEKKVILAEADSFENNSYFKDLMGYINTATDKQQKGDGGYAK
jgi:hypothetical protein